MSQEISGNSRVLPFSAMKPAFTAWGPPPPIGVPQNVAVRQVSSEFSFDHIAGRELFGCALRVCGLTSPYGAEANNARALPLAICAAIFAGSCASHARYPAMISP